MRGCVVNVKGLTILICLSLGNIVLAQSGDEEFDHQTPEQVEKARQEIQRQFADAINPEKISEKEKAKILNQYQYLDPKNEVPKDLLQSTILYFDLNKDKFANHEYVSVINYGARSDQYRFFLINLVNGMVEKFHTTHGWGSDEDDDGYATSFSDVNNSGKSSVGFARTAEVYSGKFSRAIRLDGLSASNANIRLRAIVIHGWDYVHEKFEVPKRSWGCPALDWAIKDSVIDKIQGESLINMGFAVKN